MVQLWMSVLLSTLLVLQNVDAWMQFPYDNQQFNEKREYGANVTVLCEEDDARIDEGYTFEYWIRPDLTVMTADDVDSFSTLDGDASWVVSRDGKRLDITLLNEKQFGFYYCVVKDANQETQVIKKAVNYDGPYFGNQWAKYRMNVITGCAAAGIFLVLVIFLALVNAWCCKGGPKAPDVVSADKRAVYGNGKGASQGDADGDIVLEERL